MIIEAAVESVAEARAAEAAGVQRIELCGPPLSDGGYDAGDRGDRRMPRGRSRARARARSATRRHVRPTRPTSCA